MIHGHVEFLQDLRRGRLSGAVDLPPNFPQAICHALSRPAPVAEFGRMGEAAQFTRWSVLAVEELVKIVACLQWHRMQTVAGLASNLRFISDLELRGGEEDLAVLEFVRGAADSLNNLD